LDAANTATVPAVLPSHPKITVIMKLLPRHAADQEVKFMIGAKRGRLAGTQPDRVGCVPI
jgi:hypothetical protein